MPALFLLGLKMSVVLKIIRPGTEFSDIKAAKVVLPAMNGPLTVLEDRAPTSLLLRNGQILALDENNNLIRRFFVQGGMADVALNVCAVSTEVVHAYEDMTLALAQEYLEKSNTPEVRDFYQLIIDVLKTGQKVK